MAAVTVYFSTNYGATWGSALSIGASTVSVFGFDAQRAGNVSYAMCTGKVRKATTLGGAYSDFVAFTGAEPVCVIVPYYRRNSTTTRQTDATDPDFIAALNTADSGGGTLYFVDGATGTKHDITPAAGVTFDNANCVTISYGNHIAVFGLKSGVYHLYTSTNGGTTWTDRGVVTSPHFIRCRRNDASAARGGNSGQLYLAENSAIYYSSKWAGAGMFIRNQPSVNALAFDIWG